MILATCTRIDTNLTFALEPAITESNTWMHNRRYWLATVVLIASALDLTLTQTILTLVAGQSGHQPAEANPLMASVVLTWYAWPLRVGLPALAVIRDLRAGNYGLITFAATLYSCVVIWNTHMLWLVT